MARPSYWLANIGESYDIATKHGGVVGFVAPIATVIVSIVGASALTQNVVATAVAGIGGGLLIYFGFVMLFVTPPRTWRKLQDIPTPKLEEIVFPR
jgi:hypothetical protein